MCRGLLIGVDVGVVRCLRFRVEGSEVVPRMDSPGGVLCGVASGRRRCEAVVEGCTWGSSLLLGVLVNVHAGRSRGGPGLTLIPWCSSPLTRSEGVLVLVPADGVVGRGGGGLVPIRLVEGFFGIFLVGLQGFRVMEQKDSP
jgi:hypothetical protein